MKIAIQYFASIAESAGKTEEQIEISSCTAAELFAKIKEKYKIHYDISQIRVAVNDSYVDFSYVLHDADTVVFIPPVAGG